jgi:arsenate reductase-like glutaredoxin family protein
MVGTDYNEITPEEEDLFHLSDEELNAKMRELRSSEQPLDEEVLDDSQDEVIEEADNGTEEVVEESNENEVRDEANEELQVDSVNTEQPKGSTYKVKANGLEFDFTTDELLKLAPKAMDYTKKMQEIAPYRKTLSAMEQNGIRPEDINLLIEAKNGNKEAIGEFLKRTGIDVLDIEVDREKQYIPREYGLDESQLAIKDVVSKISTDRDIYPITQNVVDQQWDYQSREILKKNPKLIEYLHMDIREGHFDRLYPKSLKMKALDGGKLSDIEYYIEAFKEEENQWQAHQQIAGKVTNRESQERVKVQEASKKKAASVPKSNAGKKSVVDYLDDSDDAYDDWYKKIMSKV